MAEMGALHLLIKFSGSRNPVSRRTGASTAEVTAQDALDELNTYSNKIKSEGSSEQVFRKYAQERSDCGSYKQGGDLGIFGPGGVCARAPDAGTLPRPFPYCRA